MNTFLPFYAHKLFLFCFKLHCCIVTPQDRTGPYSSLLALHQLTTFWQLWVLYKLTNVLLYFCICVFLYFLWRALYPIHHCWLCTSWQPADSSKFYIKSTHEALTRAWQLVGQRVELKGALILLDFGLGLISLSWTYAQKETLWFFFLVVTFSSHLQPDFSFWRRWTPSWSERPACNSVVSCEFKIVTYNLVVLFAI